MEELLPKVIPPITYITCIERLYSLRNVLYDVLGAEYVNTVLLLQRRPLFETSTLFESDIYLRVSTVEVLLAATLWIEADVLPVQIVKNCPHEIKDQMVYTMNLFLAWLLRKSERHKEERVDLGSMASAWIRLFVEFRNELAKPSWKRKPKPF